VSTVPRTIWLLWLQGWDDPPAIVRACRDTWTHRNPGWEVRTLSADTLAEYLDLDALLPPTVRWTIEQEALADVVRIGVLREHGGVWADSTVYCNRPLDEWMAPWTADGFFAFDSPARGRLLSTWFMAAAPDHPIVRAWHRATVDYWARRTARDHDRWFDRLFADLYGADAAVRARWDAAPKWPAAEPQVFTPARLLHPLTPDDQHLIDEGRTPVFKLSYKIDSALVRDDSVLAYLEQRSAERPSLWARARRAMLKTMQK
jgi:hypothetical protein